MPADQHPEPPGNAEPGRDPTALAPDRPAHLHPRLILWVVIGGAIGTVARYGLVEAVPTARGGWPIATLTVNLVGALILGMLLEALAGRGPDAGWRRNLRLFAGTGFCGGFTTYSALAVELDLLIHDHQLAVAAGYALASLVGGVVMSVLGIRMAAGRHHRQQAHFPFDPDLADREPS